MTTSAAKPFSQACVNNQEAILRILKSAFSPSAKVLEIGSGTGQHACYFAQALSHLQWQPSDRQENHSGIQQWLDEYTGQNILPLLALDIERDIWPEGFDAVFSANTAHIMPWSVAQIMLREVAERLPVEGMFALYGPFNYQGEFTSESNSQFDQWLKARGADQGIRDFEAVVSLAAEGGLDLVCDHTMPANNRLLVFKKR